MPKFSDQELKEIDERTRKIEEEREERKQEAENSKKLRAIKKKRAQQEKMVAPILLALTIIISILIKLIFSRQ